MDVDTIPALAGLALAMTWTPGPNNMMLAASGANFGWRRTVPHAMEVSVGFPVMLFLVAMGLGQLFVAEPRIAEALGWVGLATSATPIANVFHLMPEADEAARSAAARADAISVER